MQSIFHSINQTGPGFIESARRAQIIHCGAAVISEPGYARTSLAQIAKTAGIAAGVISYHFNGKDDLIGAVVTHVLEAGDRFVRPRLAAKPRSTPENSDGAASPASTRSWALSLANSGLIRCDLTRPDGGRAQQEDEQQ